MWQRNFRIWVVEKFSCHLLLVVAACTFFISWCQLRLVFFFGDGYDGGTDDMCRLNDFEFFRDLLLA